MEPRDQVTDNPPDGYTPAAAELFSEELGISQEAGKSGPSEESQDDGGTQEPDQNQQDEAQGQPDTETPPNEEGDLDFKEPEVPDEWPEDVKAAFQQKLDEVKKQWQANYTRKRQAETSEIKELRQQLEQLQARLETTGQPEGETDNEPEDPIAKELEAIRQEDPESAELTERLLKAVRQATKAEVLSEVEKIVGPVLQQHQQLQLVQAMKSTEDALGLEDGYLDNHLGDIAERIQKAADDPEYLMRLVVMDLAGSKQGGEKPPQRRTPTPSPSARSPRKSAPSTAGVPDWDAELAKIDPDDQEAITALAMRKAAWERARR